MSLTKATYSMIAGSVVNVLDFGADPTGVLSSDASIQNAINSIAQLQSGGVIFVPKGRYKISAPLVIDTWGISIIGEGPSNTRLIGDTGISAIIQVNPTTTLIPFSGTSTRDHSFKEFGLEAQANSTTMVGIDIKLANNCYTEHIWFNRLGTGVSISEGALLNFFYGLHFERCYIGIRIKTFSVNDNRFYGFEMQASGRADCFAGIYLSGGCSGNFFDGTMEILGVTDSHIKFETEVYAGQTRRVSRNYFTGRIESIPASGNHINIGAENNNNYFDFRLFGGDGVVKDLAYNFYDFQGTGAPPYTPYGENLLPNSGFEAWDDTVGNNRPLGWTRFASGGGPYVAAKGIGLYGSVSADITVDPGKFTNLDIDLAAYVPMAVLKTFPQIAVGVWVYDPDEIANASVSTGVATNAMKESRVLGNGWKYYSNIYNVESAATKFQIVLSTNNGTASAATAQWCLPEVQIDRLRGKPSVLTDSGGLVYGSLALDRGAWDTAHIELGPYHLWVDSTGDLRIKNGAPTSDTDGTVVGTQT
jgi:hypothetical protein